jgi:hypothetical protein
MLVVVVAVRTIYAHNRREPERTVSISGPADTAALRRAVARDLYSLRRRRRRVVGVNVAPPPPTDRSSFRRGEWGGALVG